jgi:hypothetical protein
MEVTFYLVGNLKKPFYYRDPPWGILIHGDFRPMGYKLSPCGSHWLR